MNSLTVGARAIELDKDGFLVDLRLVPDVASALAAAEDIELTADHWEILELLRSSTPNSSCRRPPAR
jgi:tRNA 2-thiouridine synthesizing protein E